MPQDFIRRKIPYKVKHKRQYFPYSGVMRLYRQRILSDGNLDDVELVREAKYSDSQVRKNTLTQWNMLIRNFYDKFSWYMEFTEI